MTKSHNFDKGIGCKGNKVVQFFYPYSSPPLISRGTVFLIMHGQDTILTCSIHSKSRHLYSISVMIYFTAAFAVRHFFLQKLCKSRRVLDCEINIWSHVYWSCVPQNLKEHLEQQFCVNSFSPKSAKWRKVCSELGHSWRRCYTMEVARFSFRA